MSLNPKNLKPGKEQYEFYNSTIPGNSPRPRVQYDYRSREGELFSTVAKSLDEARTRRDQWEYERCSNPKVNSIEN